MEFETPRPGVHALMLLSLLLALLSVPLIAQENRFEGQTVTSVTLEPEGQFLHPEDRAEAMATLQPGRPLQMNDVRTTIERLFGTGRFEDIQVHAEPSVGGAAVRIEVTPARFVRDVTVEGVHDPPSRGQLVNATGLQLGTEYAENQVRQSVERLMELLRSNGFYFAKVAPHDIPRPEQQMDVHYELDTGERARYSTPVVRGTPQKPVQDIIKATGWRRWWGLGPFREVTDSRTQQGLDRIRRTYQKRDYLMARVTLDSMQFREADNRVVPNLTVESGPRVEVRTIGAKISRGRLRDLLPIYQELTVDKDLLVEGRREITEYFQSRGYFEAAVDFDLRTEDQRQIIEYSIFPGDRHKLVHVQIDGNQYFDDDTLRERMYVMPASFLRFRHGRFSQDYVRRDVNAIRALYQTNGFRDVQVTTKVEDDYEGKENQYAISFTIHEGPQWFVSRLDIEGVDATTAEDLRSMLQSLEGQPYSELNVATDQDTILSYFFNGGYPQARFEPFATPAAAPNQMDLKYVITPGERQYVRDVLISGLNATNVELVRSRIRDLAPGDPLSQVSMIESQRRLYDLGIFARVDTALQNPQGDTDHKFVLYRFEEASRWSVNAGFGAQIARIGRGRPNLDTPAGAPGFGPRLSFGVSRNNFLGIGHTLTVQTQWAPRLRSRGVLTYQAPQFKGNDWLNLTLTGLYDDSRDVQTFNSRRREASALLSQRLSRANSLQYRVSWRRVSISDVVITPALIPLFARPVQLASVSTTFIQDTRDDPIDARRGGWNTIDGTFAFNTWGQPNTVFTRLLGRNATYHPVNRDVVIARQLSVGAEFRHSEDDVPFPERFFAGGVTSHRGFPDNQAGPRDPLTGFPVGGKALLMHNTELRFPLLGDNVRGVLFHDAGNIYTRFSDISFRFRQRDLQDFDYMVHAVGFGFRYRTPIGPIRLDLAYSMNSPRFMGLKGNFEDFLDPALPNVSFVEQRISRFQFHFSLGQLF
jgi:outer membrane protein assembly complex protein YaeT